MLFTSLKFFNKAQLIGSSTYAHKFAVTVTLRPQVIPDC
jgi:hypothetical protein